MASPEDERDWVPRKVARQSSVGLHHCNLRQVSVDEESIKSSGIDPNQVPWWTSKRFRLSVLCFLGFACLYAQLANLSISMVTMVKNNNSSTTTATTTTTTTASSPLATKLFVPLAQVSANVSQQCLDQQSSELGEFFWDKQLQGLLLGAYFLGHLIMQLPAVKLSERFGAKKVIAIGMFPVAILNVFTPLVTRASPYLLLASRILIGLGGGMIYPATQVLWSNWSPPWERGKLTAISNAGGNFGTVLIFPIGALLCNYGFDGGWPSIFYIIGILSFLWSVIWIIFAHDGPDSTPGISDIERKYITHSLEESKKLPKPPATPWRSIFASGAVWAIILAHTSGSFGSYMLLTQIPTYMSEVLMFESKLIGVYSMLAYLCFWACSWLGSLLTDFFIFREILSVKWTRKVLTIIGMLGGAICLIILAQMGCNQPAGAVILLCGAVGLSAFNLSGYYINHSDIAPAFAGTLFGVTNTGAALSGFLAPYIISLFTPNRTQEEWQSGFYICAGVWIFGALVYIVFGTGKQRYWSKLAEKSKDETVALRIPAVNGHRKSRSSMRTTYFDNEESHVTIECDPGESYAESAIV